MGNIIKKEVLIIGTILVLLCLSNTSESLKVLGIFALNLKSHFLIPERLMKSLARKGHEVDVYSHYPLKKPIPNYNDFSLEGTLPTILNNLHYTNATEFIQKHLIETVELQCDVMKHSVFQELFKTKNKYDVVIIEVNNNLLFLR